MQHLRTPLLYCISKGTGFSSQGTYSIPLRLGCITGSTVPSPRRSAWNQSLQAPTQLCCTNRRFESSRCSIPRVSHQPFRYTFQRYTTVWTYSSTTLCTMHDAPPVQNVTSLPCSPRFTNRKLEIHTLFHTACIASCASEMQLRYTFLLCIFSMPSKP